MKIEILDGFGYFKNEHVNWVEVKDGKLTINYNDKNGDMHEEIGDIPDCIRVTEGDKTNE